MNVATSPVRIRDDDKRLLERLRREIEKATGEKPTQQDVAGKAFEFALRHRDQFVAEAVWEPVSPKDLRKWLARIDESEGFDAVPASQIDAIVYGDK